MKKINKGFTLIELMIVVAVVWILAVIALPAYQESQGPRKVYLNDPSIKCKAEGLYFKDTDYDGYATYTPVLNPDTGMIRACIGTSYELR